MLKRRLSNAAIKSDPSCGWNAFIDLLASSAYDELNDVQLPPQLAFRYESEVQNGGHVQFFENQPDRLIQPTVEALVVVAAVPFADILRNAVDRWRSRKPRKLEDLADFISAAKEGESAISTAHTTISGRR